MMFGLHSELQASLRNVIRQHPNKNVKGKQRSGNMWLHAGASHSTEDLSSDLRIKIKTNT